MRTASNLLACIVGLCVAASALAEGYPTKPVRMIVPFTGGSGVDVVGRMVAQKLSDFWGQPVTVENQIGAGGTLGADAVAKSPPDGYTLLVNSTAHAVNAAIYAKLPYDPVKDFVAVSPLVAQPYVLVAAPSAGVKTVSDLVTLVKAKPGQVNFTSAGTGSGTHMAAEKFKLAGGLDAVHVPNKGGPQANEDAASGRVAYWFPPVSLALKPVREGKLVALGVSSPRRSGLLPDVPTIAEAGVAGFEDTIWYGVWAPAGTPQEVVDRLSQDIARALAAPDVREQLSQTGAEAMSMTPAEFARFVRTEIDSALRIVTAAGIKRE
jgi:tripartite-type tricarboxylate transporter receptor subunit TctC